MLGLMMDRPLLISSIARHAELQHPDREIVSVTSGQSRHRYTYAAAFARSRRFANALRRSGIRQGDRIATLAWNDFRHFEIYYAVSGSGFVCHTINPRLFEEQIAYIVNHAADRWLLLDPACVALVERLQHRLPSIERYVVLCDDAHMPATRLPGVCSYESLIEPEPADFDWPELDERTASALCYTSGTTGEPKGVLYSHRSTVLHCYAAALPDAMNLSALDVVMPVVPMFHVNAWALPYSCAMVGAKLVLPGPKLGDPEVLQSLIEGERVTLSAGVPTVWQGLTEYLDRTDKQVGSLERVLCGGAAVPAVLVNSLSRRGVQLVHAWGMTETSPLGTVNLPTPDTASLPVEQQEAMRVKQGRPIFGIEMKITAANGSELPRDGRTFGALKVRGSWVASSYYQRSGEVSFDTDGWFDTGDIATLCPLGYLQIIDRAKDVVKSGGEWISSVELENLALSHPAIAQAAVIAIADPKWQERPLLVAVLRPGATATREHVLQFFSGKVAKWWIPEDVVFVESLPRTATGKLSKLQLREQFSNYCLRSLSSRP